MWILLVLSLLGFVRGDTPANCTYSDISGTWNFYESEKSGTSDIDCSGRVAVVEKVSVELQYPNLAIDEYGNVGTWTMVYNQGFEVTVNGRSYFAFSDYEELPNKGVVSHCYRTLQGRGWSHDVTVRNWACFSAKKVTKGAQPVPKFRPTSTSFGNKGEEEYVQDQWKVDLINSKQKSWVAATYPHLQGLKNEDVERMKGGKNSKLFHRPSPKPVNPLLSSRPSTFLPESWDWRNVDGVNYVSEVRNQGSCGSCYAFSSMGMLEARLRILTKNNLNLTLSTQDIVSCSPLSQGCEGGFPYLIGGRYGKDFGAVEEGCNPYKGADGECSTRTCLRHYVSDYSYVGGYYGGCNEEEMKKSLVKNGPMSVSFEVYDDFMLYKSGVYHHTGVVDLSSFQPFELTNHAVLLVGYGHDKTVGEDYWIVKNSWGPEWGEQGYFRIRRGTDECAIESIAVEAFPIP